MESSTNYAVVIKLVLLKLEGHSSTQVNLYILRIQDTGYPESVLAYWPERHRRGILTNPVCYVRKALKKPI